MNPELELKHDVYEVYAEIYLHLLGICWFSMKTTWQAHHVKAYNS